MAAPQFVFTVLDVTNTSDDVMELHLEPWSEMHELGEGEVATLTIRLPIATTHDGAPVAAKYESEASDGTMVLHLPPGSVVQITVDGEDVSGTSATVPAAKPTTTPPGSSTTGTRTTTATDKQEAPKRISLFGRRS